MSKELRVSLVITVPDELFAQAIAVAKVYPLIQAFERSLADVVGEVELSSELVTPRPRGKAETEELPVRAPTVMAHAVAHKAA